jgi:hypothetical protein
MKATIHTHISGGRLVGVVLAAFALTLALSSCGDSEASTAGPVKGAPTPTTVADGRAAVGNTTVEGTGVATADGLPLLTVDGIEPGVDGYTAFLTDSIGGDYTAVISIPNLGDAFLPLEVGDVVTISGEYAESSPIQIIDITEITVESEEDRTMTPPSGPPAGDPPVIELDGSTTVHSRDGRLRVGGWLDQPAEVMVGDTPADVIADPLSGLSAFEAVVDLQPGPHAITITATNSHGLENSIVLSVLVDPALETETAWIRDVDLRTRAVVVDSVEFLTGDEATAAAQEDGVIEEGEELPGGFYLRNPDPGLDVLTLGDVRVVTLQACFPESGPCVVERAADLDDWIELISDPGLAEERHGWDWYGAGSAPYRLTLQDGTIVQIQEQYLP